MISESKVILLPLKGIFPQVTFPKVPRYGIVATQLLATLTIIYHLLKCGIIVHLVNLRHPFLSTPLDVYLVSQPERWSYVSFRELFDLQEDRPF